MSAPGFTDLRLNHQRDQSSESFWPSFTDVMTVIVMIFLMSMVVLIARNMELVTELRATVEAERRAADLVRARDVERVQLSERLEAAGVETEALKADRETVRAELASERRRTAQLTATLADASRRIESLDLTRGELESSLAAARAAADGLTRAVQERDDRIGALTADAEARTAELARVEAARKQLEGRLAARTAEVETLGVSLKSRTDALARLEQAHGAQAAELHSAQAARAGLDARLAERAAELDALTAELGARGEALARAQQAQQTQAAELARTVADRDALAARLAERDARAQSLAASLEARDEALARLEQERLALTQAAERLAAERNRQAGEVSALDTARQALARLYGESREELDAALAESRARSDELAAVQDRQQTGEAELARLRAAYETRAAELAAVLDKLEAAEAARAGLSADYGDLKSRYDRLVRPARSPQGRHLVEVRYAKVGGRADIRLREAGGGPFRFVSQATLEGRLAALQQEHPEGLYIKVIIPEDSGLSYEDAWRFTNSLHARFDYYHREQPAAEVEAVAPGEEDGAR